MRLIDDLIELAACAPARWPNTAIQLGSCCAPIDFVGDQQRQRRKLYRPLPARLGFAVCAAGSVLVTAVLTLWLRLSWRAGFLWPLVVLSSGVQALEPLTSWLGEAAGQTLSGPLAVYSILVLVLVWRAPLACLPGGWPPA